ncbi:hypothetical protein OCOL_001117 [Ordospora colligata]
MSDVKCVADILGCMNVEVAAGILKCMYYERGNVDAKRVAGILEHMSRNDHLGNKHVADILERMSDAYVAAGILGWMNVEVAAGILKCMNVEVAAGILKCMYYERGNVDAKRVAGILEHMSRNDHLGNKHVAGILERMSRNANFDAYVAAGILGWMNVEVAAGILGCMNDEVAAGILGWMNVEVAAGILGCMSDVKCVAGILGCMSDEVAAGILGWMKLNRIFDVKDIAGILEHIRSNDNLGNKHVADILKWMSRNANLNAYIVTGILQCMSDVKCVAGILERMSKNDNLGNKRVADILGCMSDVEVAAGILGWMNVEVAAGILGWMRANVWKVAVILERMSKNDNLGNKHVAGILKCMSDDLAAGILGCMNDEVAAGILGCMSDDVWNIADILGWMSRNDHLGNKRVADILKCMSDFKCVAGILKCMSDDVKCVADILKCMSDVEVAAGILGWMNDEVAAGILGCMSDERGNVDAKLVADILEHMSRNDHLGNKHVAGILERMSRNANFDAYIAAGILGCMSDVKCVADILGCMSDAKRVAGILERMSKNDNLGNKRVAGILGHIKSNGIFDAKRVAGILGHIKSNGIFDAKRVAGILERMSDVEVAAGILGWMNVEVAAGILGCMRADVWNIAVILGCMSRNDHLGNKHVAGILKCMSDDAYIAAGILKCMSDDVKCVADILKCMSDAKRVADILERMSRNDHLGNKRVADILGCMSDDVKCVADILKCMSDAKRVADILGCMSDAKRVADILGCMNCQFALEVGECIFAKELNEIGAGDQNKLKTNLNNSGRNITATLFKKLNDDVAKALVTNMMTSKQMYLLLDELIRTNNYEVMMKVMKAIGIDEIICIPAHTELLVARSFKVMKAVAIINHIVIIMKGDRLDWNDEKNRKFIISTIKHTIDETDQAFDIDLLYTKEIESIRVNKTQNNRSINTETNGGIHTTINWDKVTEMACKILNEVLSKDNDTKEHWNNIIKDNIAEIQKELTDRGGYIILNMHDDDVLDDRTGNELPKVSFKVMSVILEYVKNKEKNSLMILFFVVFLVRSQYIDEYKFNQQYNNISLCSIQ